VRVLKSGIGEHARPGRCWMRLASSYLAHVLSPACPTILEHSVFSARARKTAPEAGALPMSVSVFWLIPSG
jgi:hypothetical protein